MPDRVHTTEPYIYLLRTEDTVTACSNRDNGNVFRGFSKEEIDCKVNVEDVRHESFGSREVCRQTR